MINGGLIPPGDVDERSIADVTGSDLKGYTQCHFFAGIGGWPYALQLAGWDATRPVWTGSCPCQPFSVAGTGKGHEDKRHLWPEFARLICECEPPTVFGEQVASKLGREWLAGVRLDLEAMGYAVGAADLCAASIGAPHIRQRLWWCAGRLAENAASIGRRGRCDGDKAGNEREIQATGLCGDSRMADSIKPGLEGHTGNVGNGNEPGRIGEEPPGPATPCQPVDYSKTIWWPCRDGKWRRVPGRLDVTESQRLQITGQEPGCSLEASSGSGGGDIQNTGHDWLEVEPAIFLLLSDGISCILGSEWDKSYDKTQKEIMSYAKETDTRPGEVLREMWEAVAQKEIQRCIGGHGSFSSQEILLIALCELQRNQKQKIWSTAQAFYETAWRTMRIVWQNTGKLAALACPPHKWRLDGSQAGEPTDSLCRMSLEASSKSIEIPGRMPNMRKTLKGPRSLPEALSAVEEIWRSSFDEKSGRKRLSDCKGWAYSLIKFPLSPGVPGRVGLLRGAGNAIHPQVAAEFIKAAAV
ncbi:MAG: DNA cytosine methyltransferase [Chloroflexota bacterium]|nr:DNA cytosine methyltransferase [Chloroflexota bacterium]